MLVQSSRRAAAQAPRCTRATPSSEWLRKMKPFHTSSTETKIYHDRGVILRPTGSNLAASIHFQLGNVSPTEPAASFAEQERVPRYKNTFLAFCRVKHIHGAMCWTLSLHTTCCCGTPRVPSCREAFCSMEKELGPSPTCSRRDPHRREISFRWQKKKKNRAANSGCERSEARRSTLIPGMKVVFHFY